MYNSKTYHLINSIDHEYNWSGKYGAKGEKRAKKKKPTPLQMAYQNQKNKENRVRRLIQANFYPNDIWVCLKYPAGTRLTFKNLQKDFQKFLRSLRSEYRKRMEELKFLYRIEVGEEGGAHIHILINRIMGADLLVQKCWGPLCNFTPLYEKGNFRQLASYLVKPLPEESKQMSLFEEFERKAMSKYGRSRNLANPEPERKQYVRRTMRKIIENGPKPTKGYYIDKDSVKMGINEYTGYSYIYYTEIRLDTKLRPVKPYIEDKSIAKAKKGKNERGKHIHSHFDKQSS